MILKNIENFGFDPLLLEETKNWAPNNGKQFNVIKDKTVMIPVNSKILNVGLGWVANCDLDAAIVLLDKMGNKIVALNAYSDYSKYPGIQHSGDKQVG